MVTKIEKNAANRYSYLFRRIISVIECGKSLTIKLKKYNIKL